MIGYQGAKSSHLNPRKSRTEGDLEVPICFKKEAVHVELVSRILKIL